MVITLPMLASTAGPGERRLSAAVVFSVLLHAVAAWYFVSLLVAPTFEEPLQPAPVTIQPIERPLPPPLPTAQADPPKHLPTRPRDNHQPTVHSQVPPIPLPPEPPGPVEPTAQLPTETVPAPAPKPTYKAKIVYPSRALDGEIEGIATVQVSVAADGSVADAQVVGESPQGYGFGNAALNSVRNWQFVGAAPGNYTVTVKFNLN